MLPVLALRVHPGHDSSILRLQGAHVVLRRLDRVLLRELVAVVGPLLLLLQPAPAHLLLVLAQRRAKGRVLLLVPCHLGRSLLHLLLLRLLDFFAARAEELLLLPLEAPALLALRARHVRLRMVAILVRPPLEVCPSDVGAIGGGARRRKRAAPQGGAAQLRHTTDGPTGPAAAPHGKARGPPARGERESLAGSRFSEPTRVVISAPSFGQLEM